MGMRGPPQQETRKEEEIPSLLGNNNQNRNNNSGLNNNLLNVNNQQQNLNSSSNSLGIDMTPQKGPNSNLLTNRSSTSPGLPQPNNQANNQAKQALEMSIKEQEKMIQSRKDDISSLNTTYNNNNKLLNELKEKSESLRKELDRLNSEYKNMMGKVTSQNNEIAKEVSNITSMTSQISTAMSNINNSKPKNTGMDYSNSTNSDNMGSSFQNYGMGGSSMNTPMQNDFQTNSYTGYETPKSSFQTNSNSISYNNSGMQNYGQTNKVAADHSLGGNGGYSDFGANRQSRAPAPYQSYNTSSDFGDQNSNRGSFKQTRPSSVDPNSKATGAAHSYAEMQQRIFDMDEY